MAIFAVVFTQMWVVGFQKLDMEEENQEIQVIHFERDCIEIENQY